MLKLDSSVQLIRNKIINYISPLTSNNLYCLTISAGLLKEVYSDEVKGEVEHTRSGNVIT